jgi:hypothetical protein
MRGFSAVIIVLALPVLAQDETRIQELIQKLDDDSFEIREQAEKDLVAAGEAALPLLKKAAEDSEQRKDRGELRVRALSAMRAIEFAAKSRQVFVEPKRVTLSARDQELSKVLGEIEKQTGVKMDDSAIDGRKTVTLDVREAPLFRVLDELCRNQDERTYEYRDEGVRFQKDRHPGYPTAYDSAFRVRVVRLKQERSTDFKAPKTAQVQLSLDADWQKYLNPSRRYEIDLKKAVDDKGAALEIRRGEDDDASNMFVGGGGRIVVKRAMVMAGGVGNAEPTPQPFTLKGLSSGATRVSLQGTVRFSFPLDKVDVVFEKAAAGETKDVGDYSITLRPLVANRLWSLSFARAKGRPEGGQEDVDSRLDKDSLVAIDDDGTEHKGMFIPTHASVAFVGGGALPEGAPLATYQTNFQTLRNRTPKEIHFKFVSQAFVKSVPFAFDGLELP